MEKVKTDLRSPYYAIGDGIIKLHEATQSELRNDSQFKEIVEKLDRTYEELRGHLNATYLWD